MGKGIGSHHSANAKTVEWLTPPELIKSLGEFDLDPCSPINRVWDTAKEHFTIQDDGLSLEWFGRVWCNPPYGKAMGVWMNRLGEHGNGIGLVFARMETQDFHRHIFPYADSIFFLEGRLYFHHGDGTRAKANAGAPSVLIAYGEENSDALDLSGLKGKHWYLKGNVFIFGIDISREQSSWRILTEEAVKEFDGQATVQQVYDYIIEIAPKKIKANNHSREKVRQILGKYFDRIEPGLYKA